MLQKQSQLKHRNDSAKSRKFPDGKEGLQAFAESRIGFTSTPDMLNKLIEFEFKMCMLKHL